MRVTIKSPTGAVIHEMSLDDGATHAAKYRFLVSAIDEFAHAHDLTPAALETVMEVRVTRRTSNPGEICRSACVEACQAAVIRRYSND